MTSGSPWMTVKEAGEYMRRHPQTVLHLLHTEQLVGFQAAGRNGSWRIHRDDIDEFMRNPKARKRRRLRTA
ncbi:helix-turn-helix domain-containing protein [Rhodococcus hoagii]|uniref:helix-turn-helix domain-containing protein n=2 Tax=Rhodococcus hoagii TaxID=43767 RepID=UPI000A11FCC8|nr:helix-turn-helix domain-containing protein [Prescottella equi]NKR75833.1 helix-turn-helix domain-containing protein [Prescottella equi]NKR75900.1 helix-turn-helix domain-containing protein [Prescottella equi]NKR89739.1 helix-turn-helix domain-containing protein [Prescottella equi]NKR90349.1 helix-turn-helix domain-containing protein [Prescottella equi]NKS02497.1 helix-turn-helix domain-containing protein [Prescottella equi]